MVIIGVGLFLLMVIVSKLCAEKGARILESEEKQALVDKFRLFRWLALIPVTVLVALYGILRVVSPTIPATPILCGVIFVYIIIINILLLVRIHALAFSVSYCRWILWSRIFLMIGTGGMLFAVGTA